MTDGKRDKRERLDVILVDRGLVPSRARAQALILSGRVRLGTDRLTKPGHRYEHDVEITVDEGKRYVGRGGYKLEAACESFELAVEGRLCLDVGASTGGFTEVLLQKGARRVAALDVGRGQLDWRLRQDDRVDVIEGLNARYLGPGDLPFVPQLATIDVSFISLDRILPPVIEVLDAGGPRDLVVLVKPQFEVGRGKVGRGGIVRDPVLHRAVLEHTAGQASAAGFPAAGIMASPIAGAEGNREFLMHLTPDRTPLSAAALDRAIAAALVFPLGGKETR